MNNSVFYKLYILIIVYMKHKIIINMIDLMSSYLVFLGQLGGPQLHAGVHRIVIQVGAIRVALAVGEATT